MEDGEGTNNEEFLLQPLVNFISACIEAPNEPRKEYFSFPIIPIIRLKDGQEKFGTLCLNLHGTSLEYFHEKLDKASSTIAASTQNGKPYRVIQYEAIEAIPGNPLATKLGIQPKLEDLIPELREVLEKRLASPGTVIPDITINWETFNPDRLHFWNTETVQDYAQSSPSGGFIIQARMDKVKFAVTYSDESASFTIKVFPQYYVIKPKP